MSLNTMPSSVRNLKSVPSTLSLLHFLSIIGIFCVQIGDATVKNDCGEDVPEDDLKDYTEVVRSLGQVLPMRYQIYVNPCIESNNFTGYVNIDLKVLEETNAITLNLHQLEICEEGIFLTPRGNLTDGYADLLPVTNDVEAASILDSGEAAQPSGDSAHQQQSADGNKPRNTTVRYYRTEQAVSFIFEEKIQPGRYTLEINYFGVIGEDEPIGIYRRQYVDSEGQKRTTLLTNVSPIAARRVYPCRDDPAIKSEIHITIQTPMNYTSLVPETERNYISHKFGHRWTYYHPAINSSTHQNNFAIIFNKLENVTITRGKFTFVKSGLIDDLEWLNITNTYHFKVLTFLENLMEVQYPLKKIVQLVVPNNNTIAAANTLGLLISKRQTAVFDELMGPNRKKDIILQATNDIVDQWFVQLVSPSSWGHAWVTEGLANYFTNYAANKIAPEHRFDEAFVVWELQRRSFVPEKPEDGYALNRKVPMTPRNIQCIVQKCRSTFPMGFDQFSKILAASLIRMASHFLTENSFNSGVKTFLKNNLYKSVTPDDLWQSLQEFTVAESKSNDSKKINVSEIMHTWTDTDFYPVLNVTRDYGTGTVTIKQIPANVAFNISGKEDNQKWYIPISYSTESLNNFNDTRPSHWLRPDMDQLVINGVDPQEWIIVNNQQSGYYRVLYDKENWMRLAKYLNSENFTRIHPINRAQIINDAVQFALKGHLDMGVFLDLISYLSRETDYIPWFDAQFILNFVNYHLSNTRAYENLKNFTLPLLTRVADKIGYSDLASDDFPTLLLRRITNHWACHFNYENCLANATIQLQDYLDDKVSGSLDLQDWAKCYGIKSANETLWTKMLDKYKQSHSPGVLVYLACSESPEILKKYLDLAMANDSVILSNHTLNVFKSVCLCTPGSELRTNLCLEYLTEKFHDVRAKLDNDKSESMSYLLNLIAADIRQQSQLDQLRTLLFNANATHVTEKLRGRIKQTESRVPVFEEKADYYEPLLRAKISERANLTEVQ